MATIQERFNSLAPAHQELFEDLINYLLVLERLEVGLDRYITWLKDHPTADDSLGHPPEPSQN